MSEWCLLQLALCLNEKDKGPTHIIYLLADDLGYNDVGWHDNTILTPRLSELAESGVKFGNLYTMPACSPSRAALNTGRYSSNIGAQHYTYLADRPHGVPTYYQILPQKLKDAGYATYGVGKWHMGFCNSSYMPTNRGFDHFFGFFNDGILYYEHTNSEQGQLTLMDSMAGEIFDELKAVGMYNDSLIIFHSDNGGSVRSGSSNWPYRGDKGTFFEGGIKAAGFIAGKGIKKTGYTNNNMYHIVDMYPTLIEGVVGQTVPDDIDGINVWQSLSTGTASPRHQMLLTVDEKFAAVEGVLGCNVSAYRHEEWKLIVGYPSFSYTWNELGWYYPSYRKGEKGYIAPREPDGTDVYLFNLDVDPYETNNVAKLYPEKVKELNERLDKYRKSAWYDWPDPVTDCNPDNYDGFWQTGWC
ncbi:arylsulfatase B-like [Glandiceps talaboti]